MERNFKLCIRYLVLIMIVGFHSGCLLRRTKPSTEERQFHVCLTVLDPASYSIVTLGSNGTELKLSENGSVTVIIPAMQGERAEVLGVVYIDNDPVHYKVIEVLKSGTSVGMYSIAELEQLPKRDDCSVLDLR